MRSSISKSWVIRLWFVLALALILHEPGHDEVAADQGREGDHSACPGFVLSPDGHVVWSRDAEVAAQAHGGAASKGKTTTRADGTSDGHRGHMHGEHTGSASHSEAYGTQQDHPRVATQGEGHGHDHTARDSHGSNEQKQLMGHKDGQAVRRKAGMLCIPLGSPEDTTWMAVSQPAPFWLRAESLRRPLSHNSRSNEGLRFTLMPKDDGHVAEQAELRLWVRMPHHDHGMPGGHGPANDPDVKGLPMRPDETGTYIVPTIDFSMPGPWLFEVQVRQGNQTIKAYFAADVGEE
jgi:hypothetical protein